MFRASLWAYCSSSADLCWRIEIQRPSGCSRKAFFLSSDSAISFQGLIQIRQDVIDMLNPYGQTHQVRGDARLDLLFL